MKGREKRRKSEGGGKERVKATFNGELWSEIAEPRTVKGQITHHGVTYLVAARREFRIVRH